MPARQKKHGNMGCEYNFSVRLFRGRFEQFGRFSDDSVWDCVRQNLLLNSFMCIPYSCIIFIFMYYISSKNRHKYMFFISIKL